MTYDLPSKKFLTLAAARAIAEAALSEAVARGCDNLVVIVVNDAGNLIVLMRQDDAVPGAVEVGIAKARSAALFRMPTKEWKDRLLDGATWALAMPNLTPVEGGLPILAEGRVIGAVCVAGASGAVDTEIGMLALEVLG